jgi:dihydrofolate reductase
MPPRVRAYLGVSLDGRIAGLNDEIDWLERERPRFVSTPVPQAESTYIDYDAFISEIGVLLMGRRTLDVMAGVEPWYYDEMPVVVATSRALPEGLPDTVSHASGVLPELIAAAAARSGGKGIYIEGGRLVSAALEQGLLDELIMTVLPTVQGPGIGLFDGVQRPHDLDLVGLATTDRGAIQTTWAPKRPGSGELAETHVEIEQPRSMT